MKRHNLIFAAILAALCLAATAFAADLDEIKARGVIRHIGIPYANFVSGSGDGMEVELTQLFAKSIGVKYEYVQSDFPVVVQDLIGKKVTVVAGKPELGEAVPVKGDMIALGFTVLPWRQEVVAFSEPTFPNQIWLIARADSKIKPIKPTGDIEKDIAATKALMKGRSVLAMEKTCIDPALYKLSETGANVICRTGNLNEMAPALMKKEADLTILDVPDALVALEKWKGKLVILGPVSGLQTMAAAFPKDSPKLLAAYNEFIAKAKKDGTYLGLVKKYYRSASKFFPAFFKGMK